MSITESGEHDFRQTWLPLPSLTEKIGLEEGTNSETTLDHNPSQCWYQQQNKLQEHKLHQQHIIDSTITSTSTSFSTSSSSTDDNRYDYYYAKCLVGGGLSSSLRWALTPLDYIKCSMQAHPNRFSSFSSGLALVYTKQGLPGLYRGFTPTVLAYFSQSGCKYAMYELLKDRFAQALGEEQAARHRTLVYAVAAGSAEAVADVAMCPWEMLKIQVQTAGCEKSFPSRFGPALKSMMEQRQALNFPFGSLGPLWSRQVIGTMANFVAFEHTVNWMYATSSRCWNIDKQDCTKSTQLAVSFVAGFCSGVVSATVSHPADSLLSLRARFPEATYTEIVNTVGWNKLATQGLFPRAALTGTIIAGQWFLYDSFKTVMGLGTTGG